MRCGTRYYGVTERAVSSKGLSKHGVIDTIRPTVMLGPSMMLPLIRPHMLTHLVSLPSSSPAR